MELYSVFYFIKHGIKHGIFIYNLICNQLRPEKDSKYNGHVFFTLGFFQDIINCYIRAIFQCFVIHELIY